MNLRKTQVIEKAKKPSKLVVAFTAMAATAVIGAAGVANATAPPDPTMPSSKDACKKGGWQSLHFKNQGQCVKAANQHGSGYGGNNNNSVGVDTNVDLNVQGDNNVVSIVINNIVNIFN